jgi:transcriptional regulator with XRE-family HTH domain
VNATDTWASRIRDLQSGGMTMSEIAAKVGLSTSSIGDIATGRTKSPLGDAALKLHQLHKRRKIAPVRAGASDA